MTRYFSAISRPAEGNEEIEVLDHDAETITEQLRWPLCDIGQNKKGIKVGHPSMYAPAKGFESPSMCVSLENKLWELSNGTAPLLTISLKIQLCLYITSRGTVNKNTKAMARFHEIHCFIMHISLNYTLSFGACSVFVFFPSHWKLRNCLFCCVRCRSKLWWVDRVCFNSRPMQPSVTGTSANSPRLSGPWEHLEEKMPPPHITHAHQLALVQKGLKTGYSLSGWGSEL